MSAPQLADQTAELAKATKKLRVIDLKRMMDLSDPLAKLNRERFQAFQPDSEEGLQAAFAFNGDVYLGLKARELDKRALGWAQDHLRILSGLYGVLRPLDAIQPYRLEMGVRIQDAERAAGPPPTSWGPRVAQALDGALAGHKRRMVVNCASQEYFGAVDRAALKAGVVTCRFLEEGRRGPDHVVLRQAKRGAIAHARHRQPDRQAGRPEEAFDVDGYRFVAALSSDEEFTFMTATRRPGWAPGQGACGRPPGEAAAG